jgi:nucleotide-binding universal stress UspA family protein
MVYLGRKRRHELIQREKGIAMRVKPTSKTGGVVVELGRRERQMRAQSIPAFKLQKILVPVDFSDCSKKALQYAIAFAQQFGGELHLLYVEETYPVVADLGPVAIQNLPDARGELEGLRLTIGKGVRSTATVRTGLPPIVIGEVAAELGIDLIIMSTHGHKGLQRMFLGSTAEKVVRYAPCPVLIVREREREFVAETQSPTARA